MEDLFAFRGDRDTLTEEYNRHADNVTAGFLRLRRINRVNQRLIDNVMRHKGWTREQINGHLPADA
ncbi:MAG: hypothetical protein LBT97_02930 [Planctomycetota bacterium]|jgi:hypothetical protein|nr:hypothetical protein [Planctomycetota bacterium]